MGRGVSAGGGQSSLGYLFGSGETTNNAQVAQKETTNNAQVAQKETTNNAQVAQKETTNNAQVAQNQGPAANNGPSQKPAAASPPIDKETPAGVPGHLTNNYFRAEGQNCGNFITDRPSTKVHAAPGGGSSLGYLFGGGGK